VIDVSVAERSLRMDYYDLSFLLAIVGGLYAITGAVMNWEWFMGDPKAQVLVRLFGRTGTRVLYIILGGGLVVLGIFGIFVLPGL
jgi:hypothetical protein